MNPPPYSPASRRPIASLFRRTAHLAVRLCLRCHIHPDLISYTSILFAVGAAACFWQSGNLPLLLIPAVLLCYLRLWCNMLDGMVALAGNLASPRGEILNDLPDRISDVLIFVGVAHSTLANPFIAYWAAIAALLTAYVGTLGQAVAGHREFGGIMSKPWRMVALNLGAWLTLGALRFQRPIDYGRLTILDYTNLLIIAGCLQTVLVRLARTLRRLKNP